MLAKFDKCFGATGRNYGKVTGDRTMADIEKRRQDPLELPLYRGACGSRISLTTISARTEQCIIPYATQEGEISFCAYNTGVGWRNIIEKMHMTATLTKWYEEKGRHEIFAGNKKVNLDTTVHSLELVGGSRGCGHCSLIWIQSVLPRLRAEEKIRKRDENMKKKAEDARMEKLYRQHVLKEPEAPAGFVPIEMLGIAPCSGPQKDRCARRSRKLRRLIDSLIESRRI